MHFLASGFRNNSASRRLTNAGIASLRRAPGPGASVCGGLGSRAEFVQGAWLHCWPWNASDRGYVLTVALQVTIEWLESIQ